jgi:hypothetical protein
MVVADEPDPVRRVERRHPVRTRAGNRVPEPARRSPRGNERRLRQRELVEELRVRPREVNRDRPRRVVHLDPSAEIAGLLRRGLAGVGAGDHAQRGARVENQEAPDGGSEVGRANAGSVRVADTATQLEAVRPAAVGRHRQASGEIRNERRSGRAAGSAVRDEPVVDETRNARVRRVVSQRLSRVGAPAPGRQRLDAQHSAAVSRERENGRRVDLPVARRERARAAAERDRRSVAGRALDPGDRSVAGIRDPDGVVARGDR